MTGVALGAFIPVVVGWWALRGPRSGADEATPDAESHIATGLFREVAHNAHALLAFFALSNTDVVLARTVLEKHDAGLYAAGLILAKAVLFLPQFVVVIAFPSMSTSGGSGRTHLRGLGVVLGIGALTLAGVAVFSALALVFVGGDKYAAVQPSLWAFAVLGTVLAMLQVAVYDLVARQDQRGVWLIWAAVVALATGAFLVRSLDGLLTVVISVDAALLVVLALLGLRKPQHRDREPARQPAPVN
jgi:O-antigen/teichoic acid export membrane protein